MIIIPGPASRDLGRKIGEVLGVKIAPIEFKRFPDGESYIRFTEEVEDDDVIVVQSTGPPQDSSLIQLLLLLNAAKDLGARSITAIVPYVAYGRQDSKFRSGEAVSAKTVFKLLRSMGVDHFITVNFHAPEILHDLGIPIDNISAIPSLTEYMKQLNLQGAFSLAPDEGAINLVKASSEILEGDYGWLKKRRDRITGRVTFDMKALNLKGKDVVIFDDIISSGSTMISAIRISKTLGARRIYVACVHPLLIGDAKERILAEGALQIVGTDCITSSVSLASVAPLVAEALRRRFPL